MIEAMELAAGSGVARERGMELAARDHVRDVENRTVRGST
jgi:hypothetical protein